MMINIIYIIIYIIMFINNNFISRVIGGFYDG